MPYASFHLLIAFIKCYSQFQPVYKVLFHVGVSFIKKKRQIFTVWRHPWNTMISSSLAQSFLRITSPFFFKPWGHHKAVEYLRKRLQIRNMLIWSTPNPLTNLQMFWCINLHTPPPLSKTGAAVFFNFDNSWNKMSQPKRQIFLWQFDMKRNYFSKFCTVKK